MNATQGEKSYCTLSDCSAITSLRFEASNTCEDREDNIRKPLVGNPGPLKS